MACFHKFWGHKFHMTGENSLLPNWEVDTLIIGTFNPESSWVENNNAKYFYGRSRNYFWDAIPNFTNDERIDKSDITSQSHFLVKNRIALTDLLICIEDADIKNEDHLKRISSFKDDDLNIFKKLRWNTQAIKDHITGKDIKAIYFTKLGGSGIFENPMLEIENFANENKIQVSRLFTPSGQRIGSGKPRRNKLVHKWYHENDANKFPFLHADFNIESPNLMWN